MSEHHLYGCPCTDCVYEPGPLVLRREVRPVVCIRLELFAFFAAISALTFWLTYTP